MTQGGSGLMEGQGGCWCVVHEGHGFERAIWYFVSCDLMQQVGFLSYGCELIGLGW